jgi:xylulokinase
LNEVVIGLDLGTGGARAIAVDLRGKIVAQATQSYPLLTPQPGWTEQQPGDWISASQAALLELTQQLSRQLSQYSVMALGVSGQMHGMVALDASGNVIRPAILWNDQRTGKAVAEIEAKIPRHELIQRTGNPAVTGFQLPKLLWLRAEEPESYSRVRHLLLPKDYLSYWLTGEQVTEPSDASGVGCLNLASQNWDRDILNALDVPVNLFPPLVKSTAVVGHLKPEIAALTGLPVGLPIVAGGGDNAAAAIGLGVSTHNLQRGSLSIGTSGVVFVPCAAPVPDPEGRVHLFCHVDGSYHFLGVTLAAAGSLRWYHDTFTPEVTYEQLMALAAQSPIGAKGAMFLPHLAGERSPYLDPAARGAWVNLSLAHTQADLIRALLEGVALSLRAALEVIQSLTPVQQLLATGGGAQSSLWLQILADVLGVELVAPEAAEGAAYGAALLAMVGAEIYPNLEAALQILPSAERIVQSQPHPVYQAAFQRYTKLYEALKIVRS